MKRFLSITLVMLMILNRQYSYAQPGTFKVQGAGTVEGIATENISVTLLKASDSSLVKTEQTNKQGAYVFANIPGGTYIISLTGIAYHTAYSPSFLVDKDVTIAVIDLQPTSKRLTDVIVTARKSYIEMKADKIVVNVDASPANAGSTALEVLEKAPGVTVDKDGNILLKGRQGVQVYIDGKPSYVTGSDLANMLRGMSASQLDQLEVMTNPPAKYDAAGNTGIINIKTKKSKMVGLNGSVNASYGQGVYPKANSGFTANYRKNKLNVFSSFNYAYRGGFQKFEVNRNVLNRNTNAVSFVFRQQSYMPDTRKSATGKIGLDYDFDERTSASISLNAFNTKMTFDANSQNKIFDHTGDLQTINEGRTYMTPNVTNLGSNVNLAHKLDTTGTELVFNADYIDYTDKHKQYFYNNFFDNNRNRIGNGDTVLGNLPSGFKVYAAKIDFSKPLNNKSSKFEMGAKASYVTSDNNVRFDSIINSLRVLDVKRTNHFIYKENVYAAYLNFNSPLTKKLSVQAGLRYEYTDGRGHSITRNTTFTNQYGQLFPTVYFSYTANEKNNFNLNYGRRITRPQYRDLNPFIFIIDQYTSQEGNPYLQPQFSHNIEMSHSFKNTVTTSLSYAKVNNVIAENIENTSGTKEARLIKRNIASLNQLTLSVNVYKPINKWLTLSLNNSLFHNRFQGRLTDTTVKVAAFVGNFFATLQMKIKKGWDAEINGFYNTRNLNGLSQVSAMGMFSMAASKQVLENKGKVTLNIRDPFALQRYRDVSRYGTVDASLQSNWDNRVVTLSFTYKFGKTINNKKRSAGSATEEQGRIGA